MNGLCECGCGGRPRLAPYTHRPRGWTKGEPIRFIPGHNRRGHGQGRKPIKDSQGYIREHVPTHPRAMFNGYVLQHRLVMEQMLGRYLEPTELVHHINRVKHDNRPENLALVTPREHEELHQRLPHPSPRICEIAGCGRKHFGHGLCVVHYKRNWKHGRLELVRQRNDFPCPVTNCDRRAQCKGYCMRHYQQWRRGKLEGHLSQPLLSQ